MAGTLWRVVLLTIFCSNGVLCSDSDLFVLFGHIKLANCSCPLQISAEIGKRVWQRELQSKFYAFQLPVNMFLGEAGLLAIDTLQDNMKHNLWRHAFIVNDTGGYQLDANINCSAETNAGDYQLDTNINCTAETVQQKSAGETIVPVLAVPVPIHVNVMYCHPLHHKMCGIAENHSDSGQGINLNQYEVDDTRELAPEYDALKESSTLSGTIFVRPWHIISMTVLYFAAHLLRKLVQRWGATCSSATEVTNQAAASWEFCNKIPASTIKKGHSRQNMVASGEGCIEEAWSEAESLLWEGDSDSACFYYNCYSPKGPSEWNRDGFGRLIRQ